MPTGKSISAFVGKGIAPVLGLNVPPAHLRHKLPCTFDVRASSSGSLAAAIPGVMPCALHPWKEAPRFFHSKISAEQPCEAAGSRVAVCHCSFIPIILAGTLGCARSIAWAEAAGELLALALTKAPLAAACQGMNLARENQHLSVLAVRPRSCGAPASPVFGHRCLCGERLGRACPICALGKFLAEAEHS